MIPNIFITVKYIMYLLYILFIFIVIFLLFIIVNILLDKPVLEKFGNNITFLNKNELFNALKQNDDNYYDRFFKNDYYARKISNIDEYINLIYKASSNFNVGEKTKLIICCDKADKFFKDIRYDWFDGEKACEIEWRLGCITGKYYENGLPHTRSDIIVLPNVKINTYTEERLIKLLIHEKIHLYQKLYPADVEIYINENNYTRIKEREEPDNIRANPDLDNWIYSDKDGNINKATYNKMPSSIEDITYNPVNNQNYEHPYEKMAIDIENIFTY